MFDDVGWLIPDAMAVTIDFSEPFSPITVYRSASIALKAAAGMETCCGHDFLIVTGFSNAVQAIAFANSPAIQAIHDAQWGKK
jgi:hypothetical protein